MAYPKRGTGTAWEELRALAIGVLAGAAAFYVARALLLREDLPERPPR